MENFLKFGLQFPIGDSSRKNQILCKFEQLFQQWLKFAQGQNLDTLKITEIRSLLFSEITKFANCVSDNSGHQKLQDFLSQHDDILFTAVDKSKNICAFYKKDYIDKLTEIFETEKFEILKKIPSKGIWRSFVL